LSVGRQVVEWQTATTMEEVVVSLLHWCQKPDRNQKLKTWDEKFYTEVMEKK